MQKEIYEEMFLELIFFENEDVLCASCPYKCKGDEPIYMPEV